MSSAVPIGNQTEPALLVRLRPTSPWRIGPDSGDRDRVDRIYHSDALYAAVTGAMARLGNLDEWLEATVRSAPPAVRFTSCFPFHGEMLYVVPPRHVWPPPPSSKIRWKSATFVPLNVVTALLAGESSREDAWVIDSASECLVPASAPAGSGLFRASVRSNAAIDRNGEGVFAHSTACLEFTPGSGLWFVAVFANEEAKERWQRPVQGALRLLADSGFGGERSRGWGRAETPEFTNGNWPDVLMKAGSSIKDAVIKDSTTKDAAGETADWVLSLYHPGKSDSVDWTRGSYTVTTRGGRIESNAGWGQAKTPTRMIAEGSVLVSSGEVKGSAPDVAPQGFAHPVYRAGFALTVRVAFQSAPASQLGTVVPAEPVAQETSAAAAVPTEESGTPDPMVGQVDAGQIATAEEVRPGNWSYLQRTQDKAAQVTPIQPDPIQPEPIQPEPILLAHTEPAQSSDEQPEEGAS